MSPHLVRFNDRIMLNGAEIGDEDFARLADRVREAKILTLSGYRTGLYVSPHLVRFNDRIMLNGAEIGDEDFARLADRVREAAEAMEDAPTVFEIMTAMGMLYFREKSCDIVVLEVGMGGRLDSRRSAWADGLIRPT